MGKEVVKDRFTCVRVYINFAANVNRAIERKDGYKREACDPLVCQY